MAIFARSPKTRIFWKSAEGGTKGNFLKIAQKRALVWKAQKHSGANGIILYLYALKLQRLQNIVAQTAAPKVPEWPSYGNFRKLTQKPHFLKKCKRGTKGRFLKIPQKVAFA